MFASVMASLLAESSESRATLGYSRWSAVILEVLRWFSDGLMARSRILVLCSPISIKTCLLMFGVGLPEWRRQKIFVAADSVVFALVTRVGYASLISSNVRVASCKVCVVA